MKNLFILCFTASVCISVYAQEYQVSDHELLFMPTAYTMPKGMSYFSDYELFFLNFTRAFTSKTHIGVFTLFPITSDFLETATVGLKQNYLNTPIVASAFWATYTPKIGGVTIGNVLSLGKRSTSFHIGLSGVTETEEDSDWEIIYMLGLNSMVSDRISILAEYTNFSSFVEEDFNGLISLGIRFRAKKMAWELAGVRPLEATGELLFLPLLKATVLFD